MLGLRRKFFLPSKELSQICESSLKLCNPNAFLNAILSIKNIELRAERQLGHY
jgi:hypothetical protein